MELIKVQGRLMAIGGGEDKENDCRILKEFVRLAGGEAAKIVVITAATDSPEEAAEKYDAVFNRLGAKEVRHVSVCQRADAMNAESIAAVEAASGLFFTGGDQLHITSLMGGTDLQRTIFDRCKEGLLVAGTSAGAAMMGNSMIVSGKSDENPQFGAVEMAPGTDLVIGCIIDTHFSQRGRHGRLLTAVAHYPQDLGFGIDEDTAMMIEKDKFTVVGAGAVTVIDGTGMSYTDVPYVKRHQSITLADVKIHVLSDGYQFDLKTRQLIVPAQKQHVKAAGADENGKTKSKNANGKNGKK